MPPRSLLHIFIGKGAGGTAQPTSVRGRVCVCVCMCVCVCGARVVPCAVCVLWVCVCEAVSPRPRGDVSLRSLVRCGVCALTPN